MSQYSAEFDFRVSSPTTTGREPEITLPTFSGLEMAAILGPYARLPAPPERSGEDIGLDFNPHLPPWPVASVSGVDSSAYVAELPHLPDSPVASPQLNIAHRRSPSPLVMAVDAAADGLEELSGFPDPSLELAPLEMGDGHSFDTSVQDLIQSRPDSPIGGQEAAPMAIKPKRSFNVGTLLTSHTKVLFPHGGPLPRIEVSCHDSDPCGEHGMVGHPRVRIASESQDFGTSMENRSPRSAMLYQTSDTSPPMITAPESPRSNIRTDGSDGDGPTIHYRAESNDMEGAGPGVTGFRDFALTSDGSRSKKSSKVPDVDPAPAKKGHDLAFCEDCVSPKTSAPKNATIDVPRDSDGQMFSSFRAIDSAGKTIPPPRSLPKSRSGKKDVAEKKEVTVKKEVTEKKDGTSKKEVTGKKEVTEKKETSGKKDSSGKNGLALPVDATGVLPAPETPKPKGARRAMLKGQVAVRKCRGMVLRTPVLAVVVGRQLAPTCSQGLKLIGKGVPIETPKLVPSDMPAPVPL